jgi:CDP-glucose 4,6-dehydratase
MFWTDRRVLVTGHTGFKGGWTTLWLQAQGARVTGYALPPPTEPSLFETARVAEGVESVIGDIRDGVRLQEVVRSERPEILIHMAAQPLVRRSYQNPAETYSTNVLGTVNVLEAARRVGGVRVVVIVTSDKCYENREWPWGYRESDALGGYDPYSSSKACAELVTAAYRQSYFPADHYDKHGVAVATVRAGNVIGGGDWADDRLIPDMMRAFTRREPVLIRNPQSVRPWQHVLEPVGGYLQLAQALWEHGPQYAEAWNFGPAEPEAKPVSWIADRICQTWGAGTSWQSDDGSHPHEANLLRLDCSKAVARLGWASRWSLAQALEATTLWYKAHTRGEEMRDFTLRQIETYQNGARSAVGAGL